MHDIDERLSRLADASFFLTEEHTDLMRHLRKHEPVRWAQPWPDRGCWVVSRHADLKAVYEQPVIFSNEAAGNIIPADPDFYKADRDAQGFGAMVSNTDPPRHGELRRVFARFFSGPQIAKLEGQCQQITDEIIDELQGRTEFDFVMDAATHVPARVICKLLGVPEADWPLMTDYVNSFACFSDPQYQLGATPGETFRMAMDWTFDYIAKLVAERRKAPRDDLCSLAALAEIQGEPLSERDAAWGAWQLLAGGFETSRNVIAGGMLALIEHPDQAAMLKDNPRLIQPAIDEMLRWTLPTTANLRVATEDSEIAGQKIAKGDWVFLMIDSANRDETVFADPFRFDITRRPNPYLSFGHGIHNCIGRMLAMLEIKVMLLTMLRRTESIELTGKPEFGGSTIAKGVKHLPVRVRWKPASEQPSPALTHAAR
jgi:cholest-4-en-3-one 26-monooxygenase